MIPRLRTRDRYRARRGSPWTGRSCGLLLLLASLVGCSEEPRHQHVLLISIDTLRADRLGCYGHDRETSPALDALAADGVVFETVVAQAPWTLPSHASMFTGRFPHRHGVTALDHKLSADVPSLPALLAEHGVATAGFVNNAFLSEKYGLHRGFEDFQFDRSTPKIGDRITEDVLSWLAEHRDEAFFVFAHYYDLHNPYTPAPEFAAQFVAPSELAARGPTLSLKDVRSGDRPLDPADVEHLAGLYEAEIRELDQHLARLFEGMEELGLLRPTLVIVTSDHGEEFAEHGGLEHSRTMHRELLGIPLIMRGPGVAPGRRSDVAMLVDLPPTILAYLGLDIDATFDGLDLLSDAPATRERRDGRVAFAGFDRLNAEPDTYRMVRRGRYKLIYDRHTGQARLFDVSLDPDETEDVSAAHPQVVEQLLGTLRLVESGASPSESTGPLTDEERAVLEELGYL